MKTLQERVHSAPKPDGWKLDKLHRILRVRQGYKNVGMVENNLLSLSYGRIKRKDIDGAGGLLPESFETYQIVEPGNIVMRLTASPITAQFLALAGLLRLRPIEILTGVVAPFRSDRWGQVPVAKRNAALWLGRQFWDEAFEVRRPRRVIVCGSEAAKVGSEALGARLELSAPSGWGEVSLRRYRASDGATLIQLPHLSTFKLLSRAECIPPLRAILEIE